MGPTPAAREAQTAAVAGKATGQRAVYAAAQPQMLLWLNKTPGLPMPQIEECVL
jgi:hypothetical protein